MAILKKTAILFIIIIWGLFPLYSCAPKQGGEMFLNGYTVLDLYGGNTSAAKKEIHQFLVEFENNISVNIATSEVSRFNFAKQNEVIQLSEHVYNVFKMSLEIFEETEGAFNFCLYDLSLLWGFTPENENFGQVPDENEIENLLPFANPEFIVLSKNNYTVYKTEKNLKVDFGAIAKGYAVDIATQIAKKHGATGGTINIAGNVYCIGEYNSKGVNTPKRIAITDPRFWQNNNSFFGKLLLDDCSVSVSGDYERYFTQDGEHYSHIIDPFTGRPVKNGVISVLIVHQNAALADAYATAVMVSGAEKGLNLLNNKNITGIIITEDFKYTVAGELQLIEIYEKYTAV